MKLYRGQVVQADVGLDKPKLYLIVSNNRRNLTLGSVLGVRLTTTIEHDLPSIVALPDTEGFHGRVLCDDLGPVYADEVIRVVGALSAKTMQAVDQGLKAALNLS